MSVLITGADGFIGRRLARRFVDEGWTVTAQVRPGGKHYLDASSMKIVELDITALRTLATLSSPVDTVVHLAWAGVGPESRNLSTLQLTNLDASLVMVDVAAELGASRVICPGSMSEFALHDGPVDGSECPSPVDLYSATKVSARMLMGVRCAQLNVGLVWALITSVYGPGRNDNNVLTYAIRELSAARVPEFSGLEQIWDYIYIDDLVEALYLLSLKGRPGRCYPVGSGEARPLVSYVREVRDAINPEAELRIGARAYKSALLDSSIPVVDALVADVGFRPRVTFDLGIRTTIEQMRLA